MIKLQHVTKRFATPAGEIAALTDVNLQVSKGDIVGVIGESGAGKSTLIRCVNMLERPTQGSVQVDGQALETLTRQQLLAARRRISMIFQHFNLLATRTVWDNIALPLKFAGLNKQAISKTVTPLLELTGLVDKKASYPAQLSGGQKQRVAIARALANKPKVLLCDEATSSLDPQTTTSILHLLKDINQQLGLTILLITHEMDVIKQACDKVALIADGRIVEQGPVARFFVYPQTALGKEYVSSCFNLELPTVFQQRLSQQYVAGAEHVLRIAYHGKTVGGPFVAQLIQKFNLVINILQANIESIQQEIIGLMIVTARGDVSLETVIAYAKTQGVDVELIGYLS